MKVPALAVVICVALLACHKSHEEAVKATLAQCQRFEAGAERSAGCDELADLTTALADPFGDVSNSGKVSDADEAALSKCMDLIADKAKACAGNKAYARAMDKLAYAIMR